MGTRTLPFARWAEDRRGDVLPRDEVARILRGGRSGNHPYSVMRTGRQRYVITHRDHDSLRLLLATDGQSL